jgi:plasmid stability protein
MPASLTIKNIPDEMLARLRERAARNHRSVQGETIAILEESLKPKRLSIQEFRRMVKESGLQTPAEAADIVRKARDAR